MKKRSEKQADLDKLKGELAKVSTVILTTFQGITVQDDTKLRRSVQAAGGKYQVVKNTIAERAANGTPAEKLLSNLKGTNSIAFTNTDPVALAKALTKIAKDVPAFQFRSGIVEGRVISIAEIQQWVREQAARQPGSEAGVAVASRLSTSAAGKGVARVDPRVRVTAGQRVTLGFDGDRLHFFDPLTGLALSREKGARMEVPAL